MIGLILKKELKLYFRSPMTYFIAGVFSLIVGWMFYAQISYFALNIQKLPIHMRNQYDFSNEVIVKLFGNVNFLLLFIAPIFSMKSFSEEMKNKTIELYYTSPVSSFELVIAKYLALFLQSLFILATTLIFPFLMGNLNISDASFVFTGYLGLMLNLASYTAIGCFASSLSRSQVLAALCAFFMVLFTWLVGSFSQLTSHYFLSQILRYLSINHHFENFIRANFSLSDICFYISFNFFILLILKKRLEFRKWTV